jgi:hypothetical protein
MKGNQIKRSSLKHAFALHNTLLDKAKLCDAKSPKRIIMKSRVLSKKSGASSRAPTKTKSARKRVTDENENSPNVTAARRHFAPKPLPINPRAKIVEEKRENAQVNKFRKTPLFFFFFSCHPLRCCIGWRAMRSLWRSDS